MCFHAVFVMYNACRYTLINQPSEEGKDKLGLDQAM